MGKGDVLNRLAKGCNKAIFVVHEGGHGCEKSLSVLREELSDKGFSIKEINFSDFE